MICLWAQHVWLVTFKVTNLSETMAMSEFAKWSQKLKKEQKSVFFQTYSSVKKAAFSAVCALYIKQDDTPNLGLD